MFKLTKVLLVLGLALLINSCENDSNTTPSESGNDTMTVVLDTIDTIVLDTMDLDKVLFCLNDTIADAYTDRYNTIINITNSIAQERELTNQEQTGYFNAKGSLEAVIFLAECIKLNEIEMKSEDFKYTSDSLYSVWAEDKSNRTAFNNYILVDSRYKLFNELLGITE